MLTYNSVRFRSYHINSDTGDCEYLGDIEKYSSAVWTVSYNDIGKFSMSIVDASIVGEGKPIWLNNILWLGEEDAMVIETISRDYDSSGMLSIKVEGRSLNSLFERRAMKKISIDASSEDYNSIKAWTYSSTLEKLPTYLYMDMGGYDGAYLASDEKGTSTLFNGMSLLQLSDDIPSEYLTQEYDINFQGMLIWEFLKEFIDQSGLGCKLVFNPNASNTTDWVVTPTIYHGQDLSSDVIISDALSNVSESSYYTSITDYANSIYVIGGETEYDENDYLVPQTCVRANKDGTRPDSWQLFEKPLDDGSSQLTDIDGDQIKISDDVFKEQLRQAGMAEFENYPYNVTFEVELLQTGSFQVGRDFDIGDTIRVEDTRLGITASAQLTEVTYNISDSFSISATFGYGYPTLSQKARRKG